MKKAASASSTSAREALLPTAVPVDLPTAVPAAVPTAVPVGGATPVVHAMPQPPLSPQEMYREQVHAADGYAVQTLAAAPGLVMRERLYLSQVLFAACEKKTSFAASLSLIHI